jgi:hypothetical protein
MFSDIVRISFNSGESYWDCFFRRGNQIVVDQAIPGNEEGSRFPWTEFLAFKDAHHELIDKPLPQEPA